MKLDPASTIIDKAGGALKVSAALGLNWSTVYRWTQPRTGPSEGTDGMIPSRWGPRILEAFPQVKAEDFFRNVGQPQNGG